MTEIGVLLPTREAVMYGDGSGDPRPLVELAVLAEEAGFDSVWVGDSLLARPRAEPLSLLAAVASRTKRVALGTAVLLAALRNPEQLAQTVATVDAISSGRLVLGIGVGPDTPGVRAEYEAVGADFERRSSRSIEVVQRARQLWTADGADQMYPLPGRRQGPPMWIGGEGPRTLERTGRLADGWFPISPHVAKFASGLARVYEAAEQAGRDASELTIAVYLTVTIGEKEAAEAELAEHSLLYYGAPHEVISRVQGSTAGPVDHVGEWLQGFIDAGAQHLCVRVASRDAPGQVEQLATILDQLR